MKNPAKKDKHDQSSSDKKKRTSSLACSVHCPAFKMKRLSSKGISEKTALRMSHHFANIVIKLPNNPSNNSQITTIPPISCLFPLGIQIPFEDRCLDPQVRPLGVTKTPTYKLFGYFKTYIPAPSKGWCLNPKGLLSGTPYHPFGTPEGGSR